MKEALSPLCNLRARNHFGDGKFSGSGTGNDLAFAEAMERVKGIEPSYEAWEAAVLPLNYTRVCGPAV